MERKCEKKAANATYTFICLPLSVETGDLLFVIGERLFVIRGGKEQVI